MCGCMVGYSLCCCVCERWGEEGCDYAAGHVGMGGTCG